MALFKEAGTRAFEDDSPESQPGGRGKLRLDHRQQAASDVLIVFLVPEMANTAVLVLKLIEHPGEIAVSCSGRRQPAFAPKLAETIGKDGSQPMAESAWTTAVLEPRRLARNGHQHFLHQVVHVRVLKRMAAQPRR